MARRSPTLGDMKLETIEHQDNAWRRWEPLAGSTGNWTPKALRILAPIYVIVIARDFGEEHLIGLVEEIAIASDMKRVYAEDAVKD